MSIKSTSGTHMEPAVGFGTTDTTSPFSSLRSSRTIGTSTPQGVEGLGQQRNEVIAG